MASNNSAQRLYNILAKLANCPDSQRLIEAWSTVLKAKDGVQVFQRLAKVSDLADRVETEVSLLEGVDHEIFLSWRGPIKGLLSVTNFDVNIAHMKQHVRPDVLVRIQFCAERLSNQASCGEISEDELNEILAKVEELRLAIDQADLPRKVRAILLDLTEALRQAITEYFIRGSSGLREELGSILARVQRHWPDIEAKKEHEGVQRFLIILQRIDQITSTAEKVRAFLEKGKTLAPLLPGVVEALAK